MQAHEEETVGKRLARVRASRGWSQSKLARESGIPRQHIWKIEAGELKHPRPDTLRPLAQALNCQMEELTGRESIRQVTPYESNPTYRRLIDMLEVVDIEDREAIVNHAMWTAERARPFVPTTNLVLFPSMVDEDGDFPPPPIPPEEWIEKDTDTPRQLHAWIVPIAAEAAAGVPRNVDDILVPTAQILNTFREVRDERTHVIKIIGHSMHPTLRNGWKVLIDPARSLFQPGRIVMVYIRDEGSTIGLLAKSGETYRIVKRNLDYGGPVEILLRQGEWYPVGTVTTIVEAPVEIE